MVHLFRQAAGEPPERGPRGCRRRRLVRSRHLPGISVHVPRRPCGPTQRAQPRRQRGERPSPDPGDSRAAESLRRT